jgi:predicted tellurium resistance membrane protein TerC
MDAFLTADGLLALATLTAMEIVLGIDNVVSIAILAGRLPAEQQAPARQLGLVLALGIRIGLLGGGLFLIFKATWEVYGSAE